MRLLVLGGSSISGRGFSSSVRTRYPTAEIIDLNRSDLGTPGGLPSTAPMLKEIIRRTLTDVRPSHIVNFLGSFSNEFGTDLLANVVIPQALLDAAVDAAPKSSILLIGSAAEYGKIENPDLPVSELTPLAPLSVYGLTKMMQSLLVPFYATRFSLDVKLARTFNILAPNLSQRLFVGRVYSQIQEIKAGTRSFIEVGNVEDERDYISLERASEDYLKILTRGVRGEVYNVCSGESLKMLKVLEMMLSDAGLSHTELKTDDSIPRSAVPKIFGSREKIDAL
jgi:GDP-4-dehydro-6-deoxy-D-mannose reductase